MLLYSQISNLLIQTVPAVGVACELYPASPHWSHADRRGVSVLCQQLKWCGAEGLLVSPLSLSVRPLSFFLTNLKFGGHGGIEEGELLATHPHKGMNDLHDIQTPIVCKGMELFSESSTQFSHSMFSGFNFINHMKYFGVVKGCNVNKKQALRLVGDVHRVV